MKLSPKKTIWLMLCAVALLNADVYNAGRQLCTTFFHYGDWKAYWEELFSAITVYKDDGDRSMLPNDPFNIGYVLTLVSCPGDSYKQGVPSYDPGHAFYDAAAMLKFSIHQNTYPSGSKYNATMYAMVHPDAIRCTGPNGVEYDRVKVLQDLDYQVSILGTAAKKQISDPFVRDNIDRDAGSRDMLKLRAFNMDHHPIVVMVDFTTLMLKPVDHLYNAFLNQPYTISRSRDYPRTISNGRNTGMDMHWLLLKPSTQEFEDLMSAYLSLGYDQTRGWNNQGPVDFQGVLGMSGFLDNYYIRYTKAGAGVFSKCRFGNDNSNPMITIDGNQQCRDPTNCEDCRDLSVDSDILVLKMIHTCGKPWECHWDDSWDAKTKSQCEGFHRAWFSYRIEFETSCWHNGPLSQRGGQFMTEVFMGYCQCSGIMCYDRMIPDKPAPDSCDPNTHATGATGTMIFQDRFGQERTQTQELTLITSDTTGHSTACVNGLINEEGSSPPYNLGFVVDVSGSTISAFEGSDVGDVNNDGRDGNILDAEIGSIIEVLKVMAASSELGNDNVMIGLTSFSTHATYHGMFPPCDPNDPSQPNPELVDTLKSLRSGGYTHFDDALDKIIEFYQEAPSDRTNLLIFMSDGFPNVPGDGDNEEPTNKYYNNQPSALKYDSEIATLDKFNVKRIAIGVGAGSDVNQSPCMGLCMIDNTPDPVTRQKAELVTTTDQLTEVIMRNPLLGTVTDFSVSVNGVLQGGIDPTQISSGPTGYSFGEFVVTSLDARAGQVNFITAKLVVDYDGDIQTTDDQIVVETTNEVMGTLV